MEKPFYALRESATLVGCTVADLIHLAASEEVTLLIGVPDGIRFQIFDADKNRSEAPALLEPQLLALTATQCQKMELNGRTEQSDFRFGYLITPNGKLQLLKPSYGKAGRLEHGWVFWRTSKGPYVKEIELIPERLFVLGDDVQSLLAEQTKPKTQGRPKKKVETADRVVPLGVQEVVTNALTESKPNKQAADVGNLTPNRDGGDQTQSQQPPDSPAAMCILKRKEVEARTRLSRSTLYGKLDPKSSQYDPTFPKQLRLGTVAVGWIESEVEAWLASRQAVNKATGD